MHDKMIGQSLVFDSQFVELEIKHIAVIAMWTNIDNKSETAISQKKNTTEPTVVRPSVYTKDAL